jgi:hypothetical protein
MKKLKLLFLLSFIGSFGALKAAPTLPTVSSGDTEHWYYIKFDREWPTGSNARYLYDLGDNRPLIAVPPIENSDGILWKVEETSSGVYKIVSKRGNSIAYTPQGAAIVGTDIAGDRYYSSSMGTQLYTLDVTATDYYRITRNGVSNGGLDKSNSSAFFDSYGSGDGVKATFVPAASITEFPTTLAFGRGETNSVTNPAFGEIWTSDSLTKTFYAFGYNLNTSEAVTYSLSGTHPDQFVTEASYLTPNADGVVCAPLKVSAVPTQDGALSATLTFTHSDVSPSTTVALTATGKLLPAVLSPSEANSDDDTWYYLFNNNRMISNCHVITDKDNTIKQTKVTGLDNTQLWKVIKLATDQYQFINKGTGNKINVSGATISTAATSSSTFKFYKGTEGNLGFYVIYSNDGSKSINKGNSGDTYALYANPGSNDAGNCVRFFTEAEGKNFFYPDAPLLSTNDNEHWYQIQFSKQLAKAVEYVSTEPVLKQQTIDADNYAQYWKVTGTSYDDCRIESYSGLEIKGNGSNRYTVGTIGEGHSFKFERDATALYNQWQLHNNTASVGGYYWNDPSGYGLEVGGYNKNDAGGLLLFIPIQVPLEFTVTPTDSQLFGTVKIGETKTATLTVTARNLPDTIVYEITGAGADAFSIELTGWSNKRGGELNIVFTPTTGKEYSATLTIQAGDEDIETIALSGVGTQLPMTISTGSEEAWYYIEQGHNSKKLITNNDGRFGAFISSNGDATKAQNDLLRPYDQRETQKWKLVSVPNEENFYYLVNQDGEYFHKRNAGDKSHYANIGAIGDTAKYKIIAVPSTNYFYINRKGVAADTLLTALNSGSGYDFSESKGTVSLYSGSPGLTASPRAWRFVPEATIDSLYPDIAPKGTAVESAAWYYVKSLDPSTGTNNYLTYTGSGFALQSKIADQDSIKQLFGFISSGQTTGTGNYVGSHTYIVSKADTTKYLNQATAGNAYNWYIGHVVKPDEGKIQHTIRVYRNGNFLVAAGSGIAIQTASSSTAPVNRGDNATIETYNSVYNWAFEPITTFEVSTTPLDFGTVSVGQTGTQSVKVIAGNLSDTIAYSLTGTDAAFFAIDRASSSWDKKRGGSLNILFTPDVSQVNYSATLTLSANGEDKVISLVGEGSSDPTIVLDPDDVDFTFGNVFIGMTSQAKTVAVSILFPQGDITYALQGTDDDKAAFTVTEVSPWSNTSGGELRVAFVPTEARNYGVSIAITSTDVDTTLVLTGTGISNTYVLPATDTENGNKVLFDPALPVTEAWTIQAEINYKGEPVSNTWGSRLFSASTDDKLNFYMRPPIDWPDATTYDTGKLLLNNAAFTNVLDVDTVNGTPFSFEIISDGTGTIVATAEVNGITYTKVWPAGQITGIPHIYAGAKYATTVTITPGAQAIVAPAPAAFDALFVEPLTRTMSVYGIGTSGTFTYQIEGNDATAFSVSGTDDASGAVNDLTITFTPTEVKTYNATLTISNPSSGVDPVTVLLSGKVDYIRPFELSVSETPDPSTDKWYYLYNNMRVVTGHVITENASAIKQSRVTSAPNDAQLWKIIQIDVDKYQFINKSTSNKLHATSGSDAISTATTSNATFKIVAGTVDNTGHWVIYSNDRSKSINKSGSGDAYSLWGNTASNDAGNCVRFVQEADGKSAFYPDEPLLSTNDDEYWYRIQFFRRPTKAIEDVPNDVLKQMPIAATTTQYWKLTGTSHDNCRIESYSGREVKGNGGILYTLGAIGEGHSFKFETDPAKYDYWQLYNNTTVVNNNRYLNDLGGTEVTGFSKNDNGTFLVFTPVSPDPEFSAAATFDAGDGYVDRPNTQLLPVAGRNLPGTITYSITSDPDNAFAVASADGWSDKRGGNLAIIFSPTEVYKVYNATLTIQTAGQPDLTVALSGTGYSDPILSADLESIDFGDVTAGLASETKTMNVSIAYKQDDRITYEIIGEDKDAFTVTESSSWTETDGGDLNVVFNPTETREYSAFIEISCEKAETLTLALTGKGVITELPVTLSTDDSEVWYYIKVNKRTGQYFYDLGANQALSTGPALPNEDGQLWKVVSTGISGKYRLISKAGNQMVYTYDTDRIYTTAGNANTYSFAKRSDGHWQIRCNEEDLYIYKLSPNAQLSNTQFSVYRELPHDGSSVIFIPEAEVENRLPVFSTEEQTAWYYIGFQKERESHLVVQGNEGDQVVTQAEKQKDRKQFWKFTGTWNHSKIANIDGKELKLVGNSYRLVAAGLGDAHTLFWNIEAGETGWRIINNTLAGRINTLLSDYQESDPAEIRVGKEDGNPGHAFDIVPIERFDFTIEADAEVSATTYDPALFGDIIFQSTDASTGQLKDIPAEGLTVNGVVKVEKTFTGKNYPIGFPFAIDAVSDETYTLQAYNGAKNLFETVTDIEAGQGYLLQFPAEGTVTFTSTPHPTLYGATSNSVAEGYNLTANPLAANVTQAFGDAEALYVYDFATEAFVLLEGSTAFTLRPFEALVTVKGVTTPLYETIGAGLTNGLDGIDASDPVVDVKYYTLQGYELQRLSKTGIYIVKKIHASKKVEVIKVLYKN